MTSLKYTLPLPDQLALFHMDESRGDALDIVGGKVTCDRPIGRVPRDVFNGHLMTGLTMVSPYDIPKIEAGSPVPERLICFSEAVRMKRPDPQAWVHFYEDDYKTERFWRGPRKYAGRLHEFAGVISPDFSVYRNMPEAQKIYNTFRNQLLGAWLQTEGIDVVANVRLSGRASIPYALAGVPRNSTLALGLHGCTKDLTNRSHVIEEIQLVCRFCQPTHLVVYGSAAYDVLEPARSMGITVHTFAPDNRHRSPRREAA